MVWPWLSLTINPSLNSFLQNLHGISVFDSIPMKALFP